MCAEGLAIRELNHSLKRAPTEEEIAAALGFNDKEYQDALTAIANAGMTRLEMLDFDRIDTIGEPDAIAVDDEASRKELGAAVAVAIEQLPERLQQLLSLYYQHDCTLKEIGRVLNLSEARVCQLHTEALHRLRSGVGRE